MTIAFYKSEQDDGIAEQVRWNSSVSYASVVKSVAPFNVPDNAVARIATQSGRANASVNDFDLHYLQSVLVSTGINLNDDLFDVKETWLARATGQYKPINHEHLGIDIVGTMIATRAVNVEGVTIAESTVLDELPAKLHIIAESVLWKVWEDSEKQKRMDRILAEIAKSEWFVSQECLFKGFDYALTDESGSTKVIARSTETSFLTKYLRAYSGSGKYLGKSIARVLRNITFSGQGLTKRPANPESIILEPIAPPTTTKTLADTSGTQPTPTSIANDIAAFVQASRPLPKPSQQKPSTKTIVLSTPLALDIARFVS